ncbi:MAG: uroporphyrinogen decarboxylase family protein [Thermoproteota archaeon]
MPWYLEGPIKSLEDLESYEIPDPDAEGRLDYVERVLKLVDGEMAVAASYPIGGPLTAASFLTGFDNFLIYLLKEPRFASKLLEKVTKYCCEIGKRCIDSGIEIIFLNEDLGHVGGPFISSHSFRSSLKPHIEKLVQSMRKKGAVVLLHSDGNIKLLLEDLLEVGIQGLHPIERKASMDLGEIKRRWGDSIALIGNVDASLILPWGNRDEIAYQTLECIRNAAQGGGYILASDHSIHPGIPGQNARLMFEIARRYGKYPLRILKS